MTDGRATEERFDAVQAALRCPACGGQRRFDPASGGLVCDSCGEAYDIKDDGALDARREQAYDPGDREDEVPEIDHAHRCETCGGEVVFVGRSVSDRCPYCDGPVVLNGGHAHFVPSGLIPFGNTQDQALANIRAWVRGRWSAPADFAKAVDDGQTAAVYAPFWTFDAKKFINYTARKRVGSGKNKTWKTVTGTTSLVLDDAIIAASDHVTPAIRDGIMHGFHPTYLRPYLPEYLAGFAAELHDTRVSQGLRTLKRDVDVLARRRIRRAIGGGRISGIRYSTITTDIRFRRVLLPLWILHYRYRGQPKRIVVSGIDGKTFGERPYSLAKLLGYSLAFVLPAFLLGAMIGALLAPAGY